MNIKQAHFKTVWKCAMDDCMCICL